MSVKEYIRSLLTGLDIPDAFYADMGIDLEADYTPGDPEVGKAVVGSLAGLILSPQVSAVNENGFSMRWDRGQLGKYYLWLCRKFGLTPDKEVEAVVGISAVIDISDSW